MKLYITGPVGSGKTTLARQLSQKTGVPCFHLDQVAHEPDPDRPGGNRKRPEEERDAMFRSILEQEDYILEDTGRACFIAGVEQADRVVLLEPPPLLRRKRVVARWLRQNLGLEACAYRPTFAMLRSMFRRKSSPCSAAKKTSGAGCGAWNTDWEKGGPPCHPCLKWTSKS